MYSNARVCAGRAPSAAVCLMECPTQTAVPAPSKSVVTSTISMMLLSIGPGPRLPLCLNGSCTGSGATSGAAQGGSTAVVATRSDMISQYRERPSFTNQRKPANLSVHTQGSNGAFGVQPGVPCPKASPQPSGQRQHFQCLRLGKVDDVASACNQAMLTQLPQHARESLRCNA